MPTVFLRDAQGVRHPIAANGAKSLMLAAKNFGADIEASCGGCLVCATCHVFISPGDLKRLPAAKEDELQMLEFVEGAQANSRLSCQITLTEQMDGLTFYLAAGQASGP